MRYEGQDHERILRFIWIPYTRRFQVTGNLVAENAREIRVLPDVSNGGEMVLTMAASLARSLST